MNDKIITAIENRQALVSIFGHWPSFHDAEIKSILLDREGPDGPFLEANIHVFEMTTEIDSKGYYRIRNNTITSIRFTYINLERLDSFNHQNVLYDLNISFINPDENEGRLFKVSMPTSFGCEAEFTCKIIVVIKADEIEYNS